MLGIFLFTPGFLFFSSKTYIYTYLHVKVCRKDNTSHQSTAAMCTRVAGVQLYTHVPQCT